DLDIDRRINARCKVWSSANSRRIKWIQRLEPAATEVSKEIFADVLSGEGCSCRVVKRTTRDRAIHSISRRVLINRIRHSGCAARAFASGPSIVSAGNSEIDFFPGVLSDVVDMHTSSSWLKTEREWIAQTDCPDRAIVSGWRADDIRKRRGIVCWNSSVRINAQHFPESVGK